MVEQSIWLLQKLCPGSTYLVCYPIVCQLYNLDAMKNVELHIISRLYERTLIQVVVLYWKGYEDYVTKFCLCDY